MMEKLDFSSYPSIVSLHASLTMARIVRDSDLIFSYCEVCSDWSNGKDKIEQTVLTQTTPAHPDTLSSLSRWWVKLKISQRYSPTMMMLTQLDPAGEESRCYSCVAAMLGHRKTLSGEQHKSSEYFLLQSDNNKFSQLGLLMGRTKIFGGKLITTTRFRARLDRTKY